MKISNKRYIYIVNKACLEGRKVNRDSSYKSYYFLVLFDQPGYCNIVWDLIQFLNVVDKHI